jgi:hypothetical protein
MAVRISSKSLMECSAKRCTPQVFTRRIFKATNAAKKIYEGMESQDGPGDLYTNWSIGRMIQTLASASLPLAIFGYRHQAHYGASD